MPSADNTRRARKGDLSIEKLKTVRQGGRTAGMVQLRSNVVGGRVVSGEVDFADGRVEGFARPAVVRAQASVSDADPREG